MATHSTALHRLYESVAGSLRGGGEDLAMDEFASRVRARDLTGYSDLRLRKALDRCKGCVAEDMRDTSSVEVFAIVYEAISRRLGAWRVFGDKSGNGRVAGCQALASRLLSPYLDRPPPGPPGRPELRRFGDILPGAVKPAGRPGLDADARVVVKTMVYMGLKSRVAYPADILLPAELYRSLSSLDVDGTVDFRATDEQLLAGRAMCGRNVVEMDAGEGKTIAAAFTAVWHALRGSSVHVVTANDYLASRDANWLAPVYESLGLTVGAVLGYMDDERAAECLPAADRVRDPQGVWVRFPPRQPEASPLGAGAGIAGGGHRRRGGPRPHRPGPYPADSSRRIPREHAGLREGQGRRQRLVLRQSAAVRELIRRVDRGDGDRQSQDALLAELYLARPAERLLGQALCSRPRGAPPCAEADGLRTDLGAKREVGQDLLYTVDLEDRSVTLPAAVNAAWRVCWGHIRLRRGGPPSGRCAVRRPAAPGRAPAAPRPPDQAGLPRLWPA